MRGLPSSGAQGPGREHATPAGPLGATSSRRPLASLIVTPTPSLGAWRGARILKEEKAATGSLSGLHADALPGQPCLPGHGSPGEDAGPGRRAAGQLASHPPSEPRPRTARSDLTVPKNVIRRNTQFALGVKFLLNELCCLR